MYHRQLGVSLISLMIGLVISMIAVLGVTTLFRTVLKNNTEASVSAQTTSERASAFLITDIHLHDAGYGVDGDRQQNLRFFNAAQLSLTDGKLSGQDVTPSNWEKPSDADKGQALTWRFKENIKDTVTYCAGLWAGPDPESSNTTSIYYLTKTSCTDLADSNINWSPQRIFKAEHPESLNIQETTLELTASEIDCQGFGIAGEGKLQVKLSTEYNSILLESSTCLLNFSHPEST